MKQINKQHREPGKITAVQAGKEDHGILTVSVGIDFGGSYQSFGNLALDDVTMRCFLAELCAAFGVRDHEALVGMKCHALRCFDHWNCPIEGLEAEDGKRFTITGFRRRHYPEQAKSPLEGRQESLKRTIESCQRGIQQAQCELDRVEAEYVDWPEQ